MSELLSHHGIQPDPARLMALRHVAQRIGLEVTKVNNAQGDRVQKQRGRGMETADIRQYVDGDDIRLLDRNATARSGALQVRNVHDEKDSNILLVADFRPSMFWGTRRALRSVAACEALVMAGWNAIRLGGKVSLLAVSGEGIKTLPPRGRESGFARMVGVLVACHKEALTREFGTTGLSPDPDLSDALDIASRIAPPRSRLIIASSLDTLGQDFEILVRSMNERFHMTFLKITDYVESGTPEGPFRYRTPGGKQGSASHFGNHGSRLDQQLNDWRVEWQVIDASQDPWSSV